MKASFSFHSKVFVLLACLFGLFLTYCNKNNEDPVIETPATVSGTLTLPVDASGSTWAVLFDDDLNGDNGSSLMETGVCGSGTSISYTVAEVPAGKYYLYAIVYAAGQFGNPPGPGDFLGVYGGDFTNNPPVQPNAVVPSTGKVTFNLNLETIQGSITPGAWVATSDFGTFEFIVDEAADYITKFSLDFADWSCGISTFNGGYSVSRDPGWVITDGSFEFETDLNPDFFEDDPMVISGSFEQNGIEADGTWEATVQSTNCSGSWTAVPKEE